MNQRSNDDGSKRVKNIVAIIYLLVMAFLVGGSYWHQQQDSKNDPVAENLTAP